MGKWKVIEEEEEEEERLKKYVGSRVVVVGDSR